jgi:uncharacterized protein YjeT (DUF2065 family)
MTRSVQLFATIHLVLMGLSHVLHPDAWTEFFLLLKRQGRAGSFVHGFLTLAFGSVIVVFHPIWHGIPMLLTLLGWAYMVKAVVVFLFPRLGERSLSFVSAERPRMFAAPGVILTAIGMVLGYDLLR